MRRHLFTLAVPLGSLLSLALAQSATFIPTGECQTFVVPAGVVELTVSLSGAGGGGTGSGGDYPNCLTAFRGGAGATVQGVLQVSPGEMLRVIPGVAGTHSDTNPIPGTDCDGGGGSCTPIEGCSCFSGGGRSAIQRNIDSQWQDIVTAGGGGGAGGFSVDDCPYGAGGGAATFSGPSRRGCDQTPQTASYSKFCGGGGNSSTGGESGDGSDPECNGSQYMGGATFPEFRQYNGGGGGGFFGGGAGTGSSPGGAGSSYTALLAGATGAQAASDTPFTGAGVSGESQNGSVMLVWVLPSATSSITPSPSKTSSWTPSGPGTPSFIPSSTRSAISPPSASLPGAALIGGAAGAACFVAALAAAAWYFGWTARACALLAPAKPRAAPNVELAMQFASGGGQDEGLLASQPDADLAPPGSLQ